MNHLTSEQLSAHLDRALSASASGEVDRHLSACSRCRDALASLAAQEAALKPLLTRDPGEAYFEGFAARVEGRIRAAGLAGAPSRRGSGLGRLFESPRALAWTGAVAVVVVGAGLALMMGREVRPPELRDRILSPSAVPPASSSRKAAGLRTDEVAARESRLPLAPGTPPAPTGGRAASPGRAIEVRRNEAGEDVPVVRSEGFRFAAPPPGPADRSGQQVNKKPFAEPLQKTMEATREALAPTATSPSLAPSAALKNEAAGPRASVAPAEEAEGRMDTNTIAHKATVQVLPAGEGRLCGEVHDHAGRPVRGAQVVVTDLARTTTTDARGAFCLGAPAGEHTLAVMAVGFGESRQSVRVGGEEATLLVTLEAVPVLEAKGGRAGGLSYVGGALDTGRREPSDAYAPLPDSVRALVRGAQRLGAGAAARRSAAGYDAAAAEWERALRLLAGGPLELETRWHLAEARFHAWDSAPTARRASAAIEALTRYTTRAPAGPQREQAARWLDRVRP